MNALRTLFADRKGATAVEYGLILALIVLAMIAALQGLADVVIEMWNYVSDEVIGASQG